MFRYINVKVNSFESLVVLKRTFDLLTDDHEHLRLKILFHIWCDEPTPDDNESYPAKI